MLCCNMLYGLRTKEGSIRSCQRRVFATRLLWPREDTVYFRREDSTRIGGSRSVGERGGGQRAAARACNERKRVYACIWIPNIWASTAVAHAAAVSDSNRAPGRGGFSYLAQALPPPPPDHQGFSLRSHSTNAMSRWHARSGNRVSPANVRQKGSSTLRRERTFG